MRDRDDPVNTEIVEPRMAETLFNLCVNIYSANSFIDSSIALLTTVTHSFLLLMSPLMTLSTLSVNHPF